MADKTIAQLAGLTGDAVAPEDLLPVWDASENATKGVSIAGLKQAVDPGAYTREQTDSAIAAAVNALHGEVDADLGTCSDFTTAFEAALT